MASTVILNRVKYPHNLAGAIRACACFGIDQLIWTGKRFNFADGDRLPREERMKGYKTVEVLESERPFDRLDDDVVPICIELVPGAAPLAEFVHPRRAAYVFGPEDGHVSQAFRGLCHQFVYIPSHHCLNLTGAMNVVLAHRIIQRYQNGLEDLPHPAATEQRGEITVPGWEAR